MNFEWFSHNEWAICLSGSAACFTFGFSASHWIGRRRFCRRNEHGIEIFRSYGHQWRARSTEQIVGVLAMLAFMLGLVCLLAAGGDVAGKS